MDDLRRIIRDLLVFALITFAIALLGGCSSSRGVTARSVTDSVVMRYKTSTRDSVRIRDSVRWVTRTAIRDSVVLRVDAATGDVVGKDSWHWRDTDNNRDHFADVRKMVSGTESVAFKAVRKDSVTVAPQAGNNGAEQKETHYWRTWWLGMLAGFALSFMWKYRKTLVSLAKRLSCLILRLI